MTETTLEINVIYPSGKSEKMYWSVESNQVLGEIAQYLINNGCYFNLSLEGEENDKCESSLLLTENTPQKK